ncbi:hypothetical protein CRENBAI_019433 [Crenichthys baileyi]|uniref:Uncharacterized protein n=1 Tax=Crenichthys baileyi TaxID=28760 RepID=A0AAV9SAM1_9TELE
MMTPPIQAELVRLFCYLVMFCPYFISTLLMVSLYPHRARGECLGDDDPTNPTQYILRSCRTDPANQSLHQTPTPLDHPNPQTLIPSPDTQPADQEANEPQRRETSQSVAQLQEKELTSTTPATYTV